MPTIRLLALALLCAVSSLQAQVKSSFDAAAAFGARESIAQLHLSPDGNTVAYIAPGDGQGTRLYTLGLAKGAKSRIGLVADGKPFRLTRCSWVSNTRLVCTLFGVVELPGYGRGRVTRVVAVDSDGKNLKLLSSRENENSRGAQLHGGQVLDWLPEEDGAVLMTRVYLPDDHVGSHIGSADEGLGVDWINTRTLEIKRVERPSPQAMEYISDGHGTVRIMALETKKANEPTSTIAYLYRLPGSRDWRPLSHFDWVTRAGFEPVAVDRDLNVAYGFKDKDGRLALYSVKLDESLAEELLYARPDVDVDGLSTIGRRERVVGASYATDSRRTVYFASDVKNLLGGLSKALHNPMLDVVDASVDEGKLLLFAGTDSDPGCYYIFDRKTRELQTFLVVRDLLEGVKLATVQPITYPAADGVEIPAYLTLPPGRETAKGLPAIVMPHGGPEARDVWGFDWLAQFYAARGYVVLQPNFRGSAGYGDAWFKNNGYKSWPIAIGDVLDAGRWLVKEGIADPAKLAIVGWSYGGYAALQSAVTDPAVFKAVVAIAPVTDLDSYKEDHRHWGDFRIVSDRMGDGANMHAGSPAEHAQQIKAPVLLFHGSADANVNIEQSRLMARRLKDAGATYELVTWDDLDHHLEDSKAREQMLRKSDEFLRHALQIPQSQ